MSFTYTRMYKVPTWIAINIQNEDHASKFLNGLKQTGAHEIKWIAKEFPITVNGMSRRGWAHEVDKKMPFFMNVDFLMVAITQHLKLYGPNKTISGAPERPVSKMNRTINSGDDYVRLFNDVLAAEPALELAHLFDIGSLCHRDESTVNTFVTIGPVDLNVLRKVSDRVINIEVGEDGVLQIEGCHKDDELFEAIIKISEHVGYMP